MRYTWGFRCKHAPHFGLVSGRTLDDVLVDGYLVSFSISEVYMLDEFEGFDEFEWI